MGLAFGFGMLLSEGRGDSVSQIWQRLLWLLRLWAFGGGVCVLAGRLGSRHLFLLAQFEVTARIFRGLGCTLHWS